MNKKLLFVYEPDGLSNARTKISREQTDDIKTNSFEYLSLKKFAESDYKNPDLLILEDEAQYQIELIEATLEIEDLTSILVCDSLSTIEGLIEIISQSPKVITLDYKIGDNNSPGNLPSIYRKLKHKFATSAIVGYTNFGRKKSDKEFSAKSADELTKLLRSNGEAVIEKYGMTKTALSSILFDRMQVANLRIENEKIVAKNKSLQKEIEYANKMLPSGSGKDYIVGGSLPMRLLYKEMQQLKGTTSNVLILGERGSGKELVAQAIYEDSPLGLRSSYPFVTVNCAEFSDDNNSVISELFGHVKGAFTGAIEERKGVFEAANNGTVFLDEIGTLSKTVQEKLLRFLETGKYTKLGASYGKQETSKVRLICATNANLDEFKKNGDFREDFHDRIATIELKVPSLRERSEDISDIAEYLISNKSILENNFGNSRLKFTISQEAKLHLSKQGFPGNVRDLRNVLVRAMIKSRSVDNKIDINHIVESLRNNDSPAHISNADCKDARSFLNSIHKIVLTNYGSSTRVTQDDIRVHFVTVTGQKGVSRNEFIEKYFSPHKECIEKLISDKDNVWEETISKCGFIRNAKAKI